MVYNGRIRRIVGTNVKRIREEKEIAVKDAAEQLGVGRQYWYLIESAGRQSTTRQAGNGRSDSRCHGA
jgi:DNA-binding XRE family transcriptional regulator